METEIKLSPVLPHVAAMVCDDPAFAPYLAAERRQRMRTDYYDTVEGGLAARKYTLRMRQEDNIRMCCFKAPSPQKHTRIELSCPADTLAQGIAKLRLMPDMPPDAAALFDAPLLRVCGASFTRVSHVYQRGALVFELSHDDGQVESGTRFAPFCELELELISGDAPAMEKLAAYICDTFGVSRSDSSKHMRALELSAPQAAPSAPVSPFFIGSEMLNFCVKCGYLTYELDENKRLRYYVSPSGNDALPRLFGISFDKPCALAPSGDGEE